MNNILDERMLDVSETLRFLRISRGTLGRYFDEGLDHVVVGGRIYTSRESIHRFSVMSKVKLAERREQWHAKRKRKQKLPIDGVEQSPARKKAATNRKASRKVKPRTKSQT